METLKCKICGKEFTYEKLSSCRAQFSRHLKQIHNISLEDYIVKYDLNNVHPKCLCGCGNDVSFDKHNWTWHKYYKDSHVGKVFSEEALNIKNEMIKLRKRTFNAEEYYAKMYDDNVGKESVKDFLSGNYTLSELSEKYSLDKRTLQKMWIALKLITSEEIIKINNNNRFRISGLKRSEKNYLNDNFYSWIYNLLKVHPQKYNIYSSLKEYSKNNKIEISIHPFVIYSHLKKIYGDEIDVLMQKGYHSKEEYDFYNILKFYFPLHNYKIGFKIKNEKYAPIYDICIDNKYIIEYDSKGQFHNSDEVKEKDIQKEKEAIENQYKFLRLNYQDIKDKNTLSKIEEWLNS